MKNRLEAYKAMLQIMEENPEYGNRGEFFDGLCIIVAKLPYPEWMSADRWKVRDNMGEDIRPLRTTERMSHNDDYWFHNREERMNALRTAIKNLEDEDIFPLEN